MAWFRSQKSRGLKVCTWSGGTDEEIAAMLAAHYAGQIDIHDYWTVGDERTVSLSAMDATGVNESHPAQNVVLVLSNAGGKYLADGVTECAFQVDQKYCLGGASANENGYMNSDRTNIGGWKVTPRRTWCNSIYYNAFPSSLKPIFKQHINKNGIDNGGTIENTLDYFALRAEIEIFGECTISVQGEGSQVKLYETQTYIQKNNSAYWGRSRDTANATSFLRVIPNTPTRGYSYWSNNNLSIAPFGVI